MINLEKAKQEFNYYVEQFDRTQVDIKGKQTHSLRVMELSEKIANTLPLTQEEKEVAILIGLLHDISRFELSYLY